MAKTLRFDKLSGSVRFQTSIGELVVQFDGSQAGTLKNDPAEIGAYCGKLIGENLAMIASSQVEPLRAKVGELESALAKARETAKKTEPPAAKVEAPKHRSRQRSE